VLTLSSVPLAYRKSSGLPKFLGLFFILSTTVLGSFGQAPPRQIHVAAASDLQPVMPLLAEAYEHATGIKVVTSFGSSATLATQIIAGEPVDLFLGADFTFPEKIVAAGLADTKSPIAYAKGTLVLWARKDSPFQPLHLEVLSDERLKSVAIANELHAPYGRAAVAALKYMKLYEKLSPKLVVAENISQTAQFVESGNADVGLISLTAANSEHFKQLGTYVLLPPGSYPKIVQYGVILQASPARSDAHAFMDWLTSPMIQNNLPKMGLTAVN
jgi:molybdate transport system substrate-binding protein